MSGISKAILTAAVIAFGFVAGEDIARGTAAPAPFASSQAANDGAAIAEAALRERAVKTLQVLLAKQANGAAAKPAIRSKCHEQTWPYYTNDCLVRNDGGAVNGTVRVVKVERSASGS